MEDNNYLETLRLNLIDAYGTDNVPDSATFVSKMSDSKYREDVHLNLVDAYGTDNVPDIKTFNLKIGEVEKKNSVSTASPIGGKVGASETLSIGNEVAGLLGVKPIKPSQYAVPSPLVEETKDTSTGDEAANLLGVKTAPKTLGEFGQTTLPLAKDQKGSAERVTALYEQKAKKTDDFIQEKKRLNELEAKLKQSKKGSEEYNVIVEDFNKAAESQNKKLAEREILANEIKAAEMGYREKYGEGNRLGYFYNSFLKGIGGMSSGVADAFFNVARNIPGVVAPSMEGEDITEFRKQIEPSIREGLKEKVGAGIVLEKEKKYNDEFWTSAIGGLTASVPAMIAPYGSGLIAQAYDSGLESINSIEEGQKLPETTKTIFAASVGLAQGLLEKYGLDKIFGKQSAAASKKLAADAIKELVESGEKNVTKEAFEKIVNQFVFELKDKIVKAGGKIGQSIATEFSTGAAQEASTIAAEKILNATQGKNIFEPMSWGETAGRILYSGSQEAVGGGLLGAAAAPFSKTRNYIAEQVSEAKTQADYDNLKKEFAENVSSEQAGAASDIIDYYIKANTKIPENVPNRKEVLERIIERDDIKDEITKKKQEIEQVDEAFRSKIEAEIEAMIGRVSELNEEIANLTQPSQPSQPIITKNTTPTDEKYGTIDRGDGKGVIDLTRAEYEAEVAKQQPTTTQQKPIPTEAILVERQKEKRDAEIEEVQALRDDLGQEVELINDIPVFIDDVIDRIDLGMMVAPEMLSDAIGELDKQFDKLQKYKNDPSRTHTTAQIDAMIDVLSAVKTEIQDYQLKQSENEQPTKTEPTTEAAPSVEPSQTIETNQVNPALRAVESVAKALEDLEEKYGKRFKDEETYHLIQGSNGKYYIKHEDRGKEIKTYNFENEEQAKKFAEKEGIELLTVAKNGVGFTAENKSKYDKAVESLLSKEQTPSALSEQLLTPNTNQNEQKSSNVESEKGGNESLRNESPLNEGVQQAEGRQEENVTEQGGVTAPITEEKIEATATQANIKPKNLRDLYNVNRTLFGQNKVRSLAISVIMDKMIGAMAKLAGVTKAEIYGRLEFRKASEEELPQGVKMQVDAWHGSPYQFDKFTTEKIGTGEGAQAFGWGLYFTDLKGIAENYAKQLSALNSKIFVGDKEPALIPDNVLYVVSDKLIENNGDIDKTIQYAEERIQEWENSSRLVTKLSVVLNWVEKYRKAIAFLEKNRNKIRVENNRNIYKVSIHRGKSPSEYTWLEWDKPLDIGQKNKLAKALNGELVWANGEQLIRVNIGGGDFELIKTRKGAETYNKLSRILGNDKKASLFLLENGIDGIKYPAESIARGATSDTARGFNYVVFDENAVSIEEVIKFQKDANKARGAAMVNMDGTAIIYAITDPNVSTPLHELAHVFEHYLKDYERQTIIRNAKTNGWTTETSEYFARGFEKYLADGVAPSAEMKRIFERFKEWLTEIYNGVTGSEINIPLNDEMRAIYAKMLGEEEIAKTQQNETKGVEGSVKTMDDFDTFKDAVAYNVKRTADIGIDESEANYGDAKNINEIKSDLEKAGIQVEKVSQSSMSDGNYASFDGDKIKVTDENIPLQVLLHEIGEKVISDLDKAKQKIEHANNIFEAVTTYGASRGNDAFADNFYLYFLSPKTLKDLSPNVYAELNKLIPQNIKDLGKSLMSKYGVTEQTLKYKFKNKEQSSINKERSVTTKEEIAKTQQNETKTEQEKPLLEGVRNGGNETQGGQESTELRAETQVQEEVKATIADAVAKFYAIEGKGSQKREAAKAYRQTLEKMPTVKNIFDNIKPIFAQLEREGIITKSKECP